MNFNMNEAQKLSSFDEERETNDTELDKESEIIFYATGKDGKAIKLHNRIASIPISFGGKAFAKELEEEMKHKSDEEIIALAPFEIIGRGIAGIDEMSKAMDDNRLFFGLLQIEIGDGAFARFKNIFIHFQGDKMKALQRARANKKLGVAKELIGHCHAPLTVCNKKSFTVEFVFNALRRIFESDNIVYQSDQKRNDLHSLKINYVHRMENVKVEAEQERKRLILEKVRLKREAKERAVEEERGKLLELQREAAQKRLEMEAEKKRKGEEEERLRYETEEKEKEKEKEEKRLQSPAKKKRKGRKSNKKKDDWSDATPWTGQRVLAAIHAEMSPFNWGLFKPSQKEIKAVKWGHGSLNVLREELKDDEVLYGLMRLSFGSDRFRRSHWVYFLWTPDTMSQLHKKNRLRMKHVSYNGKMQQLLAPWTISLTVETKQRVTINDWILRVKKTVVVDGGDDLFSEETFEKALRAETEYINKLKDKELRVRQQRKAKQEMQKIEEMEEANQKRIEKANKRQSNVFTKIELKQVLNSPIKINHSKTPTIDADGNYYINHDIDYNVQIEPETKQENTENAQEFEVADSPDQDNEIRADSVEPTQEIIVELDEEELAILEEDRKRKEAEQHAKMFENEKKYRKVLQSKMVLESVELVKRTSEKLCWILFAPRNE